MISAKSDADVVAPGDSRAAATSVEGTPATGVAWVWAIARPTHPKSPVEPTVRHRTARTKRRRELEAFMGFALVAPAGPMFRDPIAVSAWRQVSLRSAEVTILRNLHFQRSTPIIDSLAQEHALPLGDTAPSQIRNRPGVSASTRRSTSGSDRRCRRQGCRTWHAPSRSTPSGIC
jgi:hypothetical protein